MSQAASNENVISTCPLLSQVKVNHGMCFNTPLSTIPISFLYKPLSYAFLIILLHHKIIRSPICNNTLAEATQICILKLPLTTWPSGTTIHIAYPYKYQLATISINLEEICELVRETPTWSLFRHWSASGTTATQSFDHPRQFCVYLHQWLCQRVADLVTFHSVTRQQCWAKRVDSLVVVISLSV